MDSITGVVSVCFGFEGAARMEIPFRVNMLKNALFRFDHGIWKK